MSTDAIQNLTHRIMALEAAVFGDDLVEDLEQDIIDAEAKAIDAAYERRHTYPSHPHDRRKLEDESDAVSV